MSDHTSGSIELEEKFAHLEKLVSDLDSVVQTLDRRVHDLEHDLATLRQQYERHLLDLHEPGVGES